MTLSAAVGQSRSLDGRQAAQQAAHQALEQLSGVPVSMGIVIFSQAHEVSDVLGGAIAMLGNTPLLGFSTVAELSRTGQGIHSVIVALLGGTDIHTRANWWPNFSRDSREAVKVLVSEFHLHEQTGGSLLFFADGLQGVADSLEELLPRGFQVAGGLVGGDFYMGRSAQIGGSLSGEGGLAAAFLEGRVTLGIGSAHGWEPVGAILEVTHSRGAWIRTLDDKPASEKYADLLGYEARDWLFPPLNRLVRLYPLGVEQHGSSDLLLRSPLRVEADGSLRMNIPVSDGLTSYLMVGSMEQCQRAAQRATLQALSALGKARPVFALVLVDVAWKMLMDADPGREIAVVQAVLGEDVPVAGGYVLGQVDRQRSGEDLEVRNQHIQVVLFGEV
ncbi:MAG TPA: hypothetical protein ENJ02_06630 [Chloroflexi bacterium]|nr:hypothetical protein [Chloroflexota bacterium]